MLGSGSVWGCHIRISGGYQELRKVYIRCSDYKRCKYAVGIRWVRRMYSPGIANMEDELTLYRKKGLTITCTHLIQQLRPRRQLQQQHQHLLEELVEEAGDINLPSLTACQKTANPSVSIDLGSLKMLHKP